MATNPNDIAAKYGFAAAFFNQDPELQRLLNDAIKGKWTTEVFQARFMNTNWYRARQASQRQWKDLETRDPAEAADKIHERKIEFADMASQWGITMDDTALSYWAKVTLEYSYTPEAIRDLFASMVDFDADLSGTPATLEMQIMKVAGDYGVTLSEGVRDDFVRGLLSEKYTEDNYIDYLRDMAKSKYTGMTAYLDQGMTVRQVAMPYLDSYARLLEVEPDTVDLNDNLIQQALQGTPAAQNQPPAMQSVYQFERSLRRDPRWLRTKNARSAVTDAGFNVLRDWGLVG